MTDEVAPDGRGKRLTITEDGEVYDPFFRFVARFGLGHEGTLREYVGGVEAELGG